jgi:hypothetical protein
LAPPELGLDASLADALLADAPLLDVALLHAARVRPRHANRAITALRHVLRALMNDPLRDFTEDSFVSKAIGFVSHGCRRACRLLAFVYLN